MKDLMVINQNGQFVIDSRDVAEMIDKRHDHLLRDIEGYIETLDKSENPNLGSLNFFISNTYTVDGNTKRYPCYLLTRKGCDMVGNKMTGEKGVLFTAAYVTKFEEMEKSTKKQVVLPEIKKKEIEARYNNSLARRASILVKISNNPDINPRYRQVLQSQASAIAAGQTLLPLPEAEEQTYTAAEIGERLGISANMVGKIANKYSLKTPEYGKLFHDKSPYSSKEVETFRYYESVVSKIREALSGKIVEIGG
jgi:Rha family phage regulatory protein